MKLLAYAAIAITCLNCGVASAATETWYLQNVTTVFGAAVTGSFAYNADTGSYSNINIDVGNVDFTTQVANASSTRFLAMDGVYSNYSNKPIIGMVLSKSLTDAGGTVSFSYGDSGFGVANTNPQPGYTGQMYTDWISSGSVTTTSPVPEPETNAMLLGGLGLLGLMALRRKNSQV